MNSLKMSQILSLDSNLQLSMAKNSNQAKQIIGSLYTQKDNSI